MFFVHEGALLRLVVVLPFPWYAKTCGARLVVRDTLDVQTAFEDLPRCCCPLAALFSFWRDVAVRLSLTNELLGEVLSAAGRFLCAPCLLL